MITTLAIWHQHATAAVRYCGTLQLCHSASQRNRCTAGRTRNEVRIEADPQYCHVGTTSYFTSLPRGVERITGIPVVHWLLGP